MRTIKNDLMISNRYVDVTTMLIDISEKQDNFTSSSISKVINSYEETTVDGRSVRIQAARLLDVITDDRSTYQDIKKLEITDLCIFLNLLEKVAISSYFHDTLFRKEPDPNKISAMRIIEVICSIIIYGREYSEDKDDVMPFPEELYHLDGDPNITEWYIKKNDKKEKEKEKE